MAKKVSAAHAKAHLSELVAEAAYAGEHIIIERRGKPLAALVGLKDLEHLEQCARTLPRARGALALLGAWKDVPDKDLDSLVSDIYAERERDAGRHVELEV